MKGLIVFSNHMEDVEALATRALLIRAGLKVDSMTFQNSKTIQTAFNQEVMADYTMDEVDMDLYDFVVIPGGKYVSEIIEQDVNIKLLATHFYQAHKLVAAICAGPRFLGQVGLLDGKNFTAFTGSEKDMPKGQYQPEKKVVRDQNIITARGAGAVYDFAYEIVKYMTSEIKADALLKNILF
jgi:protein deglycase